MKSENLIWTKEQWFAVALDFSIRSIKRRRRIFAFEDIRIEWFKKGYQAPHSHCVWGALATRIIKDLKLTQSGWGCARSLKTHSHPVKEYFPITIAA